MSQVSPAILLFIGLLSGVLLYPLANLLAASGLGGFFDACARVVLAPFTLTGRLFRKRGGEERVKEASERGISHEEEIKATAQMLRKILLSLAVIIQRADQATTESNQTLGDVRNTIKGMDLPKDLSEVHMLLMREIDRMITGNSTLKQELSRSQDDLANQRKQIEELRSAARMDGLTQLANRAYFDEKILEMVKINKRYNDIFSLLLVDVDNFKEVNDKYGHQAGDRILKGVAFNLRSTLRESDFVARFGGDEFAILLFKSDSKSAVEVAFKLCHAQQENRFLMDGVNIKVTISIGVAEADVKDTPETLFKRADQALLCAKSEGRNGVRYQSGRVI
jgi:diguanylate cyclase